MRIFQLITLKPRYFNRNKNLLNIITEDEIDNQSYLMILQYYVVLIRRITRDPRPLSLSSPNHLVPSKMYVVNRGLRYVVFVCQADGRKHRPD